MNKFDPNEVFINSFGRRIKNTGTKVDIDPLTTHCALLDNCFCTKNADCGKNQICTTIDNYSYRVCQTKNEVPINFFPKLALPNATDLFNFFTLRSERMAAALLSECSIESLFSTFGDTSVNTGGALISGFVTAVRESATSFIENGIFGFIKG